MARQRLSEGRWSLVRGRSLSPGPAVPGEARLGFGSAVRPARSAQARDSRASQPLSLPAGCLCTVGILAYGILCFKRGNTRRSQLMMRARVLAQGFTIAAVVGGMMATTVKSRQ